LNSTGVEFKRAKLTWRAAAAEAAAAGCPRAGVV
jgi:hypothetical protein